MDKEFKKELSNLLDYLEDKIEDVYMEEVKNAIKEFKEEHSI